MFSVPLESLESIIRYTKESIVKKIPIIQLGSGQKIQRHLIGEVIQMANKHMKRYSILLVIKEMQMRTIIRSHYIPIRTAKIKKKYC